jgi:hypothetical protein
MCHNNLGVGVLPTLDEVESIVDHYELIGPGN